MAAIGLMWKFAFSIFFVFSLKFKIFIIAHNQINVNWVGRNSGTCYFFSKENKDINYLSYYFWFCGQLQHTKRKDIWPAMLLSCFIFKAKQKQRLRIQIQSFSLVCYHILKDQPQFNLFVVNEALSVSPLN